MTDIDVELKVVGASDYAQSLSLVEVYKRPTGIRGLYSHPVTQVIMLGFTCFMCPGKD